MKYASANITIIFSGCYVCNQGGMTSLFKGKRTLPLFMCWYNCAEKQYDLSCLSTVPNKQEPQEVNFSFFFSNYIGCFYLKVIYHILHVLYFHRWAGHWTTDRKFPSGTPFSNRPEDTSIFTRRAPGRHS